MMKCLNMKKMRRWLTEKVIAMNILKTWGNTLSQTSTSLAKRFKILPSGVTSKNVIGKRRTAANRIVCITFAAAIVPSENVIDTMHWARTTNVKWSHYRCRTRERMEWKLKIKKCCDKFSGEKWEEIFNCDNQFLLALNVHRGNEIDETSRCRWFNPIIINLNRVPWKKALMTRYWMKKLSTCSDWHWLRPSWTLNESSHWKAPTEGKTEKIYREELHNQASYVHRQSWIDNVNILGKTI